MTAPQYDLVVIGGGPGGYEAAIRGAQMGMKVACIENRLLNGKPSLGGTCLNVGCIPSKALLDSSERYESTQHDLAAHGITTGDVKLDLATLLGRKNKIVDQLTSGIAALFKGNGITWLQGTGQVLVDKKVKFTPLSPDVTGTDVNNVEQILSPSNIIIATGSSVINIPSAVVDQEYIVDSTGALAFETVPQRLAVIGAGVIGLELGSVWRRLGSSVTIFEAMDSFLPSLDRTTAKETLKLMTRQGLNIQLSAKVTATEVVDGAVNLTYTQKDETKTETFDKVIVCVGRKAFTEGVLSADCGVKVSDRGMIDVDEQCRTNIDGIWAIGDCVRGPMLAHKAMEEGVMVVERMHGHMAQVNYSTIIGVIYTHPEVAWVGLSEEEAVAQGHTVKVGQFAFAVNGRAMAADETAGFVRVIGDDETDRLLGMQIVGANAGDMIHEGMIALEFASSVEDLQLMTFAHPTLSEVVHEAALAADGRAIHAIQRKRR